MDVEVTDSEWHWGNGGTRSNTIHYILLAEERDRSKMFRLVQASKKKTVKPFTMDVRARITTQNEGSEILARLFQTLHSVGCGKRTKENDQIWFKLIERQQ